MDKKRLLTIGQAAARLGISPSTLRVYADKGDVPFVRLPSKYRRFDPDVIERIAAEWQMPFPAPSPEPQEGDSD